VRRKFLKSKLHRASITDANLNYEGSISIDPDLMEAADILPLEKVDVVNINTGARFSTYVIKGKKGSREIGLNGGAARLGVAGDRIIVISYINLGAEEIPDFKARIVLVSEDNNIKSIHNEHII